MSNLMNLSNIKDLLTRIINSLRIYWITDRQKKITQCSFNYKVSNCTVISRTKFRTKFRIKY